MAQIIYIKCPVCGWTHIIEKKGTNALMEGKMLDKGIKGRFKFCKNIDGVFEDIREGGGKASGFHRIDSNNLAKIVKSNKYPELIEQLRIQCENILAIIKEGSPI